MDQVDEHLPFNPAQHMHLEHFVRLWLKTIKDAGEETDEHALRAIMFASSLQLFMDARDAENLMRG